MTTIERQRIKSLGIANERRMSAAAWRRRVSVLPMREGLNAMVDEILDPEEAASMPLLRFLNTAIHMGDYKARQILNAAMISDRRAHHRLRDLTDRERRALACAIQDEVWKA